jgi:hypothetical protein
VQKLYHLSETPGMALFHPRPSPSYFKGISGDVVFAISERLRHNYLFPRDCPRVTYYANERTTTRDKAKFLASGSAYVVAVESNWLPAIHKTSLHSYEFSPQHFQLIDEVAGYYVSYHDEQPLHEKLIADPFEELIKDPFVDIRILPEIRTLADEVSKSSLNFSLIRMRNAL